MKTLAVLLLLAAAVSATAQQTEIIALDPAAGAVTWTNETTNAYCGIEWSFNLTHSWLSLGVPYWQIQPTTTVTTVQFPMDVLQDAWPSLYYLWDWRGLGEPQDTLFFRLVASTNPLVEPDLGHWIRFTNSSDTALGDISFFVKPDIPTTAAVTNFPSLAPSSTLPEVWAAGPRVSLGEMDFIDIRVPNVTNFPGWHITWTQAGTNRHCGTWFVPFGDPDKTVTVTVYSNRVETHYNWLGPGGTVPY